MAPGKFLREVKAKTNNAASKLSMLSGIMTNNDQNIAEPLKQGGNKRKTKPSNEQAAKRLRSALGNLTNAVNYSTADDPALGTKKRAAVPSATENISVVTTRNKTIESKLNVNHFQPPKTTITSLKVNNQNSGNVAAVACEIKQRTVLGAMQIPNVQSSQTQIEPRPTKVMTRAAARANVPPSSRTAASGVSAINIDSIGTTVIHKQQKKVVVHQLSHDSTTTNTDQVQQLKPTRRISNEFEKSKTEEDTLYMSALENL